MLRDCLCLKSPNEDGEESIKVATDFNPIKSSTSNVFYQDVVDIVLKKMDQDKDGHICYNDFKKTVSFLYLF